MKPSFLFHCVRRDISNFALVRRYQRDFAGYLVTGQNSGTHWLKYMIGLAIAKHWNLPEPQHVDNQHSNELIGHPKHKREYASAPRIASSHSIPHYFVGSSVIRAFVRFPPYFILVRDMRDALVSNYLKHERVYTTNFSQYLRVEPGSHRYIMDVWWYIHFLNRWGNVIARFPEQTKFIRYEDLRADPKAGLDRIFRHFGYNLPAEIIDYAVANASKRQMNEKVSPHNPVRFIRADNASAQTSAENKLPGELFSDDDRHYLAKITAENLRHDFGYDYSV